MIKKIYNFFFPDDTKIKIECSTDAFWDSKKQKLIIHRKFYTFRSIVVHYWCELFVNPLKTIQEIGRLRPGFYQVGAIAFDAVSSTRGSTSPITFSHTCTGSNLVLTVGASGVRAHSSCTYNGVSMTAGTQESDGTGLSRMFYLGNPATGANTVSLTLASDGDTGVGAISFSGANATSPLDVQDTSSVTGTDLSMTVTTNYANSFLVDTVHKQADPTANASQTVRWSSTTSDYYGGSTKPTTTAGAYSTDWSGSSATWGGAMIAIREYLAIGPTNLKSLNTNLTANIKSINTNLIANVKSVNTNT